MALEASLERTLAAAPARLSPRDQRRRETEGRPAVLRRKRHGGDADEDTRSVAELVRLAVAALDGTPLELRHVAPPTEKARSDGTVAEVHERHTGELVRRLDLAQLRAVALHPRRGVALDRTA